LGYQNCNQVEVSFTSVEFRSATRNSNHPPHHAPSLISVEAAYQDATLTAVNEIKEYRWIEMIYINLKSLDGW